MFRVGKARVLRRADTASASGVTGKKSMSKKTAILTLELAPFPATTPKRAPASYPALPQFQRKLLQGDSLRIESSENHHAVNKKYRRSNRIVLFDALRPPIASTTSCEGAETYFVLRRIAPDRPGGQRNPGSLWESGQPGTARAYLYGTSGQCKCFGRL